MITRILFGFAVLSFVFLPLERLLRVCGGQRFVRAGFRTDLAHFAFNGTLGTIGLLIVAAPFALVLGALAPLHGVVTAQPAALQFFEALLLLEVLGYFAHRLTHRVPALWSSTESTTAASRWTGSRRRTEPRDLVAPVPPLAPHQ